MSWAADTDPVVRPDPAVLAAEPGRLVAGANRRVGAPLNVVRQHLLRVMRDQAFTVRTEQLSVLEGHRGSKIGGVTLSATRSPVMLRIGLDTDGSGCRASVVLADRWPGRVGRNWGVTTVYVGLFETVLTAVDDALRRLDPAGAAGFTGWWRHTGSGDVAIMQNAASLANRAGAALSRRASRLLDGGSAAERQSPVTRVGNQTFTFEAEKAVAEVPAEIADGMLMVGTLVTSRPGNMPPNLVAQVQALVFRVEAQLASVDAGHDRTTRFLVEPPEVPVVTFLYQQARLRSMLPVRTLRICTTCRLEKVINPELERLQERTRRARDLATSLSAMITPYVLAGRLAQLNNKEPSFACPRCQGMEADETVVTFCQRCGDRRAETALRTCSACQFDFRTLIAGDQLWRPRSTPPPAPEQPAALAPAPEQPAALPPAPEHAAVLPSAPVSPSAPPPVLPPQPPMSASQPPAVPPQPPVPPAPYPALPAPAAPPPVPVSPPGPPVPGVPLAASAPVPPPVPPVPGAPPVPPVPAWAPPTPVSPAPAASVPPAPPPAPAPPYGGPLPPAPAPPYGVPPPAPMQYPVPPPAPGPSAPPVPPPVPPQPVTRPVDPEAEQWPRPPGYPSR